MQSLNYEDQVLWTRWKEWKDPKAGDDLMRRYMPLVTYHVGRISVGLPKSVHKDDLMSLGMLGLYDALEKFDPSRDLKFDTYASFRIRGAIIDGLRKEDWLPRTSREKTKKVEAAIEKLAFSSCLIIRFGSFLRSFILSLFFYFIKDLAKWDCLFGSVLRQSAPTSKSSKQSNCLA